MTDETFEIQIEPYTGDDEVFVPGTGTSFNFELTPIAPIVPPVVDPIEGVIPPIEFQLTPVTTPTGTTLPYYIPPSPIIPGQFPTLSASGTKRLCLNIETTGFKPWERQIIAIGFQDPLTPDKPPTVIINNDEKTMLKQLFTVIKSGGYNELVGYGLSFDFRFVLIRAMKYDISCKEFYDLKLYDLMQAIAQGKFSYMYYAPKPPSLSDISDFFWGYPKPFTDLEMMKYWKLGQLDKVIEFTSSQISRILALYYLFRKISESSFTTSLISEKRPGAAILAINPTDNSSRLTFAEANNPDTKLFRCPNCMSEMRLPISTVSATCSICGEPMEAL